MSPPTLKSMAQRACGRNIAGLQDVGDMAYDLVRPILRQIDNPQQLRNIEIASPQIADHDAELWRAFIARDIPQWEEKIVEPKNPRSWWKVYRKLIREEQRAKEEQEAQLKASLMGIDKQKKQIKRNTFRKLSMKSSGQIRTPVLQNAKTGDQVLRAIRKQSAAANKQRGLSKMVLQPAKDMLPSAKSQITRAPEGMLRDHGKPVPSAVAGQQAPADGRESKPAARIFVTRGAPSKQEKSLNNALREERTKKEDRLRALTGVGPKATGPTSPPPSTSRPAAPASPLPVSSKLSPPKPASPVPTASPRTELSVAAEVRKRLSPSPAPPLVRKRPAPAASVFMPSKKKEIMSYAGFKYCESTLNNPTIQSNVKFLLA